MHGRETLMCLVDKEALILEKPPVESVKEQFILYCNKRGKVFANNRKNKILLIKFKMDGIHYLAHKTLRN